MVLHLFLGDAPLFHVAGYHLVHPAELRFTRCSASSAGPARCVREAAAGPATAVPHAPSDARLATSCVGGADGRRPGFFVPEVLGVGYDDVERVLNGDVVLGMLVAPGGPQDRRDRGLLRIGQRRRHLRPQPLHRRNGRGAGGSGAHRSCRPRPPGPAPTRWSAWAPRLPVSSGRR